MRARKKLTIGRHPRCWLCNVNCPGVVMWSSLTPIPISVSIDADRLRIGDLTTTNRSVVTSQLQRYERTYRALAAELATVGFISQGSVVLRYTSCGKPGCRCQGDPPQRHGPYYQWSRAVAGQDREPPAHRGRGRALPQLDRQPAAPRTDRRPDGADLSSSRRTPPTSNSPARTTPVSEALTGDKWGAKRSSRSAERQRRVRDPARPLRRVGPGDARPGRSRSDAAGAA